MEAAIAAAPWAGGGMVDCAAMPITGFRVIDALCARKGSFICYRYTD